MIRLALFLRYLNLRVAENKNQIPDLFKIAGWNRLKVKIKVLIKFDDLDPQSKNKTTFEIVLRFQFDLVQIPSWQKKQ